jgi:hypothetical protein
MVYDIGFTTLVGTSPTLVILQLTGVPKERDQLLPSGKRLQFAIENGYRNS